MMNNIKETMDSITKQGWIIGGATLLIIVILGLTVWPFSIFNKKDQVAETDSQTEEFVDDATAQVFTPENIANGEYRNDSLSATTYVQHTQEVQVAVVVGEEAQEVIGDTIKVSCGQIALATTRVIGPAVLTNSLKALFEGKIVTDFEPGNIIPSYHPELTLENVVIEEGVAKITLGGNFDGEKDGLCGASLAIAQIVETAKTFDTVSEVEVYQDGKKIN